jgi:hypothetical protein
MAYDLRNPYGMLGLPFGANREAASRAFARKARGLRRQPGSTEALTQLTWALNQIEEAIKDPRTALHLYRVPADPGSLDPEQPGVLKPPPVPLARTTPPSADAWAALLDTARGELRNALLVDLAERTPLPAR